MKVRTGHIALQFNDSNKQHSHDIKKVFKRAVDRRWAWVTGTESGPGSGNTARELEKVAADNGYRPWIPALTDNGLKQFSDCWVAVREDLIDGDWHQGFIPAIPGSEKVEMDTGRKKWAPKGLAHVEFNSDKLGPVAVGSAHYLTDARDPSSKYWRLNKDLTEVIGMWAKEEGAGKGLVFYGGDQNMADDKNRQSQGDTFMGQQLTSAQDELKQWANTGYGAIDVIASYNKDERVKALSVDVFNDKRFFLNTDHFLVEATFLVDPVTTNNV